MRVTVASIKAAVERHYRLPTGAMESPCRNREWAHPRQIAMYISHRLSPLSRRRVSQTHFGGRDPTTALHAERVVEARRASDPRLDLEVRFLLLDIMAPAAEGPEFLTLETVGRTG